jgi:regulator of protease activity HflC (stomatin/prohibitin superfamily)
MPQIRKLFWFRHLRAEPNQFVLHWKNGRLRLRGPGLSYWFDSLSAAVAQLPVEDCETTFVLKERSLDFQEVTVQCTITYRIADPERAASRVNFSLNLETGAWCDAPLERLASVFCLRAQPSARSYLAAATVVEALRSGPDRIRQAVSDSLKSDPELEEMGLSLVSMQIDRVAPTSEVEKALQTPTREGIQEKADQAVFARRALAVEKERAIKENELSTEIELSRRTEELVRQRASNRRLEVESEAAAERTLAEARAEGEARRVEVWSHAPNRVVMGLALQELARNIQQIQHLNLTPDLLGQALQQFVTDQAGK